jgi:nicotinate-nucleotide adenylyltransferase
MLKLAFKNNENIVISDIEREEYHYTYQNMAILKEKYKDDELYLIIGADNLFELNTWKNYMDLLSGNSFIVFGRNDLNIEGYINNNFTNWKNKFIIKEPVGNLSSTLIRESVKKGNNLDAYLSAPVKDYILEKHLYKGV